MPLGVILMNENTSSEMIEIMEEIQKFVPATQQMVSLPIVVLGSDQLSCEQARIRATQKRLSYHRRVCIARVCNFMGINNNHLFAQMGSHVFTQ